MIAQVKGSCKEIVEAGLFTGFWGNTLELNMKALVKIFVFVGLILLVAGVLAWKAPAAWVLSRIHWSGQDIHYARITGTLWQGGVEQLIWGELMLGDVKWDFLTLNDPTKPATTWRVNGKGLDYEMSAFVDFEGQKAKGMRFVQGHIPAAWVDLSKAAPLVFLGGRFDLDLDYAALSGYTGRLASGTIRWSDAGLTGLVEESLGSVIVQLRSEKGFTIADIQSEQPADIMISGDLRFNAAQYRTNLVLTTTPEKQYVVQELAHLGTVLPDGSLELTLSGNMPR